MLHHRNQGIGLKTVNPGIPEKSEVFLEIKVVPSTKAVAAIKESPKFIFFSRLISIYF
jgi:hypothetical protein